MASESGGDQLAFRLPRELVRWFKIHCVKKGLKLKDLGRQLIEEYRTRVEKERAAKKGKK